MRRVSTEEVRHNIQKEKRILDTLEPVVHQHRLVVNQRLLSQDMQSTSTYGDEDAYAFQFFFQFTRLTRDRGSLRHDDRVDVVAMAVVHFIEQVGKDVDLAARESREALRDQAMREFMGRVERKERRQSGWHDNWAGDGLPRYLQN